MSTISSGTTLTTALVQTGDTTGDLVIRTGSSNTTAMTISGADQSVTFAGAVNVGSTAFANGSASAPSITFTGDTNTGIFSPAADTIAFTEGGVESMRINSAGNVGIGTSNPGARLQIGSATFAPNANLGNNLLQIKSPSGFAYVTIGNGDQANSTSYIGGASGFTTFGSVTDAGSLTERMRIDGSGNVGINGIPTDTGFDTTDARLYVVAPNSDFGAALTTISDSLGRNIRFANQAKTTTGGIDANSTGISVGSTSNHPLVFNTNNSERMRIDSSGNVGIGTTNPQNQLHINGAATGYARFQSSNRVYTIGSLASAFAFVINDVDSGQQVMQIDAAGLFKFNSGYGSVATAYGCRAWVNFTGSNGAVNGSGNVSSVTRNGTGYYTVNFSSAMPDTNYSMAGAGKIDSNNNDNNSAMVGFRRISGGIATGSAQVAVTSYTNSALDCERVTLIFAR